MPKKRSRFKLFVENIMLYGFGGIIKGIIPFLMLPITTRLLPNTEYFGISDMVNVLVQFSSAFAILGMYDAMFRLFFDKSEIDYKKEICSTAGAVAFCSSTLVALFYVLFRFRLSKIAFGTDQYPYLILIAALTIQFGNYNHICSAPTRMQNKRIIYLIINTLSPIISQAFAIIFLLKGFYSTALPLSVLFSIILQFIAFGFLNWKWFRLKYVRWKHLKPLFIIALPLVPNYLIYWIFGSCDRLMITQMLGAGAEGIYAAGGKLGQLGQLIYTAFAGGWQYFAFSTMRDDDQVRMTGHIFEYLGALTFAACAVMMACNRWIYTLMFPDTYQEGMTVVPYLFLAPLLMMLFQTVSNQFLVIKKTWPSPLILGIGAVSNIVVNRLLIPTIGIEGAAVGTLVGYILSVALCSAVLSAMNLIVIPKRFYLVAALFICFGLCWRFWLAGHDFVLLFISAVLVSSYVFLYREDLEILLHKQRKK